MTRQICKIENCNRPVHGHDFCSLHYMRWSRHGDPLAGTTQRGAVTEFIQQAINYAGNDCLIWPYTKSKGYGQYKYSNAHRFVCRTIHGEPPIGTQAAHSCGNKLCVNPAHLRWATPKENDADKDKHGTRLFGEDHPRSKLTKSAIKVIRQQKGIKTSRQLGKQFGVHHSTVLSIWNNETWC